MIWLVVLGLAAWTWSLAQSQSDTRALARRLTERLEALERRPGSAPAADPRPAPQPTLPPEPVAEAPPLWTPPRPGPRPEPQPRPGIERPAAPSINLSQLLAERGLAWLGGAALLLGGIFLVGYAAQRGLFTPPVRLASAVLASGAMLAASEWLRRPGRANNPLAAAILAGAGAGALYATLWAAWALYHYLPAPAAVVGMTAVSGLLLALSPRHGEPLALLALLGGFLAPALAGWSEAGLALHVLIVTAAGFAAAGRRGWSRTALAAIAGAGLYGLIAPNGLLRLLKIEPLGAFGALALTLPLAAMGLAWSARRRDGPAPAGLIGPLALAVAAVNLALFWLDRGDDLAAPAGLALLVLAGALAARRGWISSQGLAAPLLTIPPAVALLAAAADPAQPLAAWRPAGLALAATLVVAGLLAPAAPLAAAAALLSLIAAACRLDPLPAALVLEGGALVLAAAAWLEARRAKAPRADLAVDAWSLAAGLALVIAVRLGARAEAVPVLEAGLALAIALIQHRLGWRGLTLAALVAGGSALAATLDPRFVAPALAGGRGAAIAVGACLAAALALALGGRALKSETPAPAQALAAGAVGLALIGAFIGLRWCASSQGIGLSLLLEASLRTLLLALSGAALVLVLQGRPGIIAQAGPHLLLAAAAVHGLAGQMLALNPLWGFAPRPIEATPLLNSLAVAYLAPALAFALAAGRLYRGQALWARPYAILAGLFGLAWAVLTLRHCFHGPDLTAGASPFAEAVLLAALPALVALVLRQAGDRQPAAQADMSQAAAVTRWIGLPLALIVTGLTANPWWGADHAPLGGPGLALLAALGLLLLAALAWQAGGAERQARPHLAQTARLLAAGQLLVLITLTVRWIFHPTDLRGLFGSELETWAYSAVWAAAGAGLLAVGSSLADRGLRWLALAVLGATAVKVALFDTANLEGVVRAGSFMAVGALMVAAAVAARRLGASRPESGSPP